MFFFCWQVYINNIIPTEGGCIIDAINVGYYSYKYQILHVFFLWQVYSNNMIPTEGGCIINAINVGYYLCRQACIHTVSTFSGGTVEHSVYYS